MSKKDYSKYLTKKPKPEDKRPFWVRLFDSIRPRVTIVKDKRSNKMGVKVEIRGGTDF